MYVREVDILAQLSDAAHLPFVLFPVSFLLYFVFFFVLGYFFYFACA